jgi:hypothetical protein
VRNHNSSLDGADSSRHARDRFNGPFENSHPLTALVEDGRKLPSVAALFVQLFLQSPASGVVKAYERVLPSHGALHLSVELRCARGADRFHSWCTTFRFAHPPRRLDFRRDDDAVNLLRLAVKLNGAQT